MTCRTGLGLLVLTTGLTLGSVALAGDNPNAEEPAAEKAKTGEASDKSDSSSPDSTADDKAKTDDKSDDKAKTDDKSDDKAKTDDKSDDKAKTDDKDKQVAQNNANSGGPGQGNQRLLPGADEEEEEERLTPPRVPWRGSAATWSHSASASALGIGDDFQGDDFHSYSQSLGVNLNYFIVDEDKFRFRMSTAPSFSVELTDSGVTTTRNEPQMNDLNLSAVLSTTWFQDKEANYAIGGIFNLTHLFPTSPISQSNGTIVTMSPRFLHWHSIPLLPADVSPVLNSVFAGISFRWDHRFGLASTAVNDSLQRPRTTNQFDNFLDDQLTGARITQDTLRQGGFLFFQEKLGPTTLQFFVAMSFNQRFLDDFGDSPNSDCVVNIDTGCVPESATRNPEDVIGGETTNVQYGYGFAVGATFFPMNEWGIDLSYGNQSNTVGPDGQRQSPFYSPQGANFSTSLLVSIDAIYERIIGPGRNTPMVLFGQNDTNKKKRNDKRRTRGGMPIAF